MERAQAKPKKVKTPPKGWRSKMLSAISENALAKKLDFHGHEGSIESAFSG